MLSWVRNTAFLLIANALGLCSDEITFKELSCFVVKYHIHLFLCFKFTKWRFMRSQNALGLNGAHTGMQLRGNATDRLVIRAPLLLRWYACYFCSQFFLSVAWQRRARSGFAWDQKYCGICIGDAVSVSNAQWSHHDGMMKPEVIIKIQYTGVCLFGPSVAANLFGAHGPIDTCWKEMNNVE